MFSLFTVVNKPYLTENALLKHFYLAVCTSHGNHTMFNRKCVARIIRIIYHACSFNLLIIQNGVLL